MTTYYKVEESVVENDDDDNNLILFTDEDYGCKITKDGDKFSVVWTEFVANEWVETYDKLSTALMRFAMLAACKEEDWDAGFCTTPEQHVVSSEAFMAANIG